MTETDTHWTKIRIGCWIFDGFETLDLHGPVEMLSYMYGYPIEKSNVEIFYIGEVLISKLRNQVWLTGLNNNVKT